MIDIFVCHQIVYELQYIVLKTDYCFKDRQECLSSQLWTFNFPLIVTCDNKADRNNRFCCYLCDYFEFNRKMVKLLDIRKNLYYLFTRQTSGREVEKRPQGRKVLPPSNAAVRLLVGHP